MSTVESRLAVVEGVAKERENEIKRLRRSSGDLALELEKATAKLERFSTIQAADMKVPAWLRPKEKTKAHRGTPVLMLSDLHLDEVVDLEEMDGMNEYNRGVAEKRFDTIINSTQMLMKKYTSGVHFDGVVVPLLGDIITGDIHEELARTNECPVPATIVHWVPIIASGLRFLADEFGHVHVPCVVGNHDRTTYKTPKKKRMESSYGWIIYNWLADSLRDDPRVTFGISTSPEQLTNVYSTTLLLSHGDSFRSAGGVGGLYPSLMKWLLRRHDLYSQTKSDFDYALIGHWHQDLWGPDFVVNGSLKGYDEYARDGGFKFGRPSQQLFLITPERGMTQRLTVHAE